MDDQIKPELMQCYLEVNTGICRTVDEARLDLCAKLATLEQVTQSLGLQLFWGRYSSVFFVARPEDHR